MSFYVMKQDTLIPGSAALDGTPDFIDPSDWLAGKIMPAFSTPPELKLSVSSGDYRGSIIQSFLPLFHYTLEEALVGFGIDNVQFHKVILIDPETSQQEFNYRLANIIGRVDCVDLQKSKINYWPSQRGYDLLSIVIDETKTNGLKIFRIKDDPTLIIINEELRRHLVDELNILVGTDVIRAEDYSRW